MSPGNRALSALWMWMKCQFRAQNINCKINQVSQATRRIVYLRILENIPPKNTHSNLYMIISSSNRVLATDSANIRASMMSTNSYKEQHRDSNRLSRKNHLSQVLNLRWIRRKRMCWLRKTHMSQSTIRVMVGKKKVKILCKSKID